jgi:hypothetical protein
MASENSAIDSAFDPEDDSATPLIEESDSDGPPGLIDDDTDSDDEDFYRTVAIRNGVNTGNNIAKLLAEADAREQATREKSRKIAQENTEVGYKQQ